jgi:hypothetical protein
MGTNNSTRSRCAVAQNQGPVIPEPTFRSAVWIGAVGLIVVVCILIYGLINSH